jgi:methionyl-tRNA synthetase
MFENKKILITSALPYANNIPHLGNIIGCVLSADVFARFCRSKYGKENVLYVCGTDEHGTTTETKAVELGITPEEVTEKFHKIHTSIYNWFGCSFDIFGRTSSKNNHEIAQDIFLKLDKNGFIVEDDLEQLYCEKCEMYLADRFVEGTCPKCGYENARGDQCDNCSNLLNATELINPRCKFCNETPIVKKERHLFIDLPKLAPKLKSWIDLASKNWSQNAKTMTQGWLRDGLRNRCISRDLKWGIPIPKKDYEHKVFYSWFDAPIGYIGITKDLLNDNYKDWWLNPENVNLFQFMGKDNIPFHTILFPSFLIGSGDNYTLLHQISSTEYLNYEDSKFSKSRGTGVFGDDVMQTGIPADVWRYYLLSNRPENSDTIFTWHGFQEKTNNELLANLGNFVNRTLTFLFRNLDGVVPGKTKDKELTELFIKVKEKQKSIIQSLEKVELRRAINEIFALSKIGNVFFQTREPWKHKEDKEHLNDTVYACTEIVRKLAVLVEPYLPNTSKEIFAQLNLEPQTFNDLNKSLEIGHKINQPKVLFKKLEDKQINELHDKFSGQHSKKITINDIDLRVAKIINVKKHPKADKLYIEELDLGYEKRTIISGLVGHYSAEELVEKNIIVVANLKSAKLRGIESKGMLLAAQNEDKQIGLILAPNSKPGDKIYLEGSEPKPRKQIDINQFFSIKITAKGNLVLHNNKKFRTDAEFLIVDKELDGLVG